MCPIAPWKLDDISRPVSPSMIASRLWTSGRIERGMWSAVTVQTDGQPATTVRANLMVYFTFIDMIGCVAYLREGLFTREVVVLSLLLGLPFILAMVAGVRWFRIASERSFRHVAYAIIALSALLSLPLFDGLLR